MAIFTNETRKGQKEDSDTLVLHLSKLKTHSSTACIKRSEKVPLQAWYCNKVTWCITAAMSKKIPYYTNIIIFFPLIAKILCWVFLGWRFSLCSYIHVNFAAECIVSMHWTVHFWELWHHLCLIQLTLQLDYPLVLNSSTWEQEEWNIPSCTSYCISFKHLWLNSQQPQPIWINIKWKSYSYTSTFVFQVVFLPVQTPKQNFFPTSLSI